MKVNLLLDNNKELLNGHINIDPFTPDESSDQRIKGEVSDLSFILDDSEAEEIVSCNILEYFEFSKVDGILDGWLKKLKKGGTLILGFTDLEEASRLFYQGHITLEQVNHLFFGRQDKGWNFKKSGFTLDNIVEILRNKGYKVLSAKLEGVNASVVCQRVS